MTTVTERGAGSAWSVPAFRRFWTATVFSAAGTQSAELVLPALAILSLDATAQEVSWMRVAQFLPFLLLTLWLGVLVDRRRKRPLMIGSDVVRGGTLLAAGVAAITGQLTMPLLIGAAAVLGTFAVVQQLASFSLLPSVVPTERLPDANARIAGTESALEVGGGSLGGAVVQGLSAPVATVATGASFLGSALLLARVRAEEEAPAPSTRRLLAEAWEGLTVLWRHRIVRPLATEASIWNFGWEVFVLALTVEFLRGADYGPLLLGLVLACGGLGGVVGSLLSASLTARFGYGRSLVATMVVGNTAPLVGTAAVASGAPAPPVVYMTALLISGVGIGVANAQAVTVRQLVVDAGVRGRVNSAYRLMGFSMIALGAGAAGALVVVLGATGAALAGGVVMAAACVPVVLSPVRRMRATTEDDLTAAPRRRQDRPPTLRHH